MIIGIGGVSRAGKTTLAKKLAGQLKKEGKTVEIFCQDEYVKPKMSIPKVQGVPDWERPSTIKWDSLTSSVQKSKANVKIVEGLFSFYPASLRVLYDVKIFIEIDKPAFQKRRTADERWDEEPEWYAEHVWKSYMKYGLMKGDKAEYIKVDGSKEFDLNQILSKIPN